MRYLPFLMIPIFKRVFPVVHYSVFNNSSMDFRYGSKNRKSYKKAMKYTGYVQDHHCIPKQFKNNKVLRDVEYDVNMPYNIQIMPTLEGIQKLNLDPNTRTHYKGHPEYNKFIGKELNIINNLDTLDEKQYQIWLLLKWVKYNNIKENDEIPWI